ncbi:glutathione S-transferase 1-like [Lutzomyia longipalpis]|uniref:glutathione S-transferase 1-like n=1 Tax=Lutzomyia longipalpis TaxID=7200 RepID=UPI00248351B0|nr:glutathione S-transferase 1-like [Lutzomyia longipalpis]
MTIDLYYSPASSPCRSILLLGKTLGIHFNLIETRLCRGDNFRPEFSRINYEHSIPTLVDNGFALWESRAILIYLADKYGKEDTLYPKNAQRKAIVNQRLYFDMGTLFQRLADCYLKPVIEKKPVDPQDSWKMEEAVGFLNIALAGHKYAAGDTMTIADFALVATISTYEGLKFDLTPYANVTKWFNRCKKHMRGYEINQRGVDDFVRTVAPLLPKTE